MERAEGLGGSLEAERARLAPCSLGVGRPLLLCSRTNGQQRQGQGWGLCLL